MRRWTAAGAWLGCVIGGWLVGAGIAAEVKLKDGTILNGKAVPLQSLVTAAGPNPGVIQSFPILMVEQAEAVRTFVPARMVGETNRDVALRKDETFKLSQRNPPAAKAVTSAGAILDATPFDPFGRRTVSIQAGGKRIDVIQGITELTPTYAKVRGLTHLWEYGIPTSSLDPDQLDAMLHKAIKPGNPEDRMAIARFYLQAGMFQPALRELDSVKAEFPDVASQVEEITVQVVQEQALWLLGETKRRGRAGQYALIDQAVAKFPSQGISGAILQQVRELAAANQELRDKIDQAIDLLGRLQADLPEEQRAAIAPLRSEIVERLHPVTLDRLQAFLTLAEAENLTAQEKLALAFSGWVLGSGNAITEFDTSLHLWQARFHVREYLLTESPRGRQDLLTQIRELEGISPERVAAMLPLLPPRHEIPDLTPGRIQQVEAATLDGGTVRYAAVVPAEYHPLRSYPLIVALREGGVSVDSYIQWWTGSEERMGEAPRLGYIVIAPEYIADGQREYDGAGSAHRAVLDALYDARKRFNVDSDRVYLSGHGLGGNATFDIGFAHPDLFAAVIPIVGVCEKYTRFYWPNSKRLPVYAINGELDGDTVAINSKEIGKYMFHGHPIIYAEHIGRGHEHFFWEQGKLFDWMPLHVRNKYPKEIDVKTLRPTDNVFWWWQFSDFPPQNTLTTWPAEKTKISPMVVDGKITPGNTVQLRCGAGRHAVWLSPELIDFEKRVVVTVNGARKFNDFLTKDIEAMLEDYRLRGDRQKLTWARLDF